MTLNKIKILKLNKLINELNKLTIQQVQLIYQNNQYILKDKLTNIDDEPLIIHNNKHLDNIINTAIKHIKTYK